MSPVRSRASTVDLFACLHCKLSPLRSLRHRSGNSVFFTCSCTRCSLFAYRYALPSQLMSGIVIGLYKYLRLLKMTWLCAEHRHQVTTYETKLAASPLAMGIAQPPASLASIPSHLSPRPSPSCPKALITRCLCSWLATLSLHS
jgi:hypothetical protein